MHKRLYPLYIVLLLLTLWPTAAQAADMPHNFHLVATLITITPDEGGATTATLTFQAPNKTFVYLSFAGPRLVAAIQNGIGLD